MNRLIVIFVITGLSFAIEPVPRIDHDIDDGDDFTMETVIKGIENVIAQNDEDSDDDKNKDNFIDVDSNGVNDSREEDLQKIKDMKKEFEDMKKKKKTVIKKEKTKKTSIKTKPKTPIKKSK